MFRPFLRLNSGMVRLEPSLEAKAKAERIVKQAVLQFVSLEDESGWKQLHLCDPALKFKIVHQVMVAAKCPISNPELTDCTDPQHIVHLVAARLSDSKPFVNDPFNPINRVENVLLALRSRDELPPNIKYENITPLKVRRQPSGTVKSMARQS